MIYYRKTVLIHLKDNNDKFRVLVMMFQKLFQVSRNHYLLENPDSVMFQELLLGGHLCLKVKSFGKLFLIHLKTFIY